MTEKYVWIVVIRDDITGNIIDIVHVYDNEADALKYIDTFDDYEIKKRVLRQAEELTDE